MRKISFLWFLLLIIGVRFAVASSPYAEFIDPTSNTYTSDKDQTITISISDPDGIDETTIRLLVDGVEYSTAASELSWEATTSQLIFTPTTSFSDGSHRVTLVSADDSLGNQLSNQGVSITFIVDTTVPRVLFTYPENGDKNIKTDTSIEIYFSEPINSDDIFSAFTISGEVDGSLLLSSDKKKITFSPYENLSYNTLYEIMLDTSKIYDNAGLILTDEDGVNDGIYKFTFETEGIFTVEVRDVEVFSKETSPIYKLRVVFNTTMNKLSVLNATSLIKKSNLIEIPCDITTDDNQVFEIFPYESEWSTLYELRILTAALDSYGNHLTDEDGVFTYEFTTASDPAPSPTLPEISEVFPVKNSEDVKTDVVISILFNKEMNPAPVESAFKLKKSGTEISGSFRWSADYMKMEFVPDEVLEGNTNYQVSFDYGSVKDKEGYTLTDPLNLTSSWKFTTETFLNVLEVSPQNNSINNSLDLTVKITFDLTLEADSINSSTFKFKNEDKNIEIPGKFSLTGNDKILEFIPTYDNGNTMILETGTVYSVRLVSGENGIKSVSGEVLASDYTFSFKTKVLDEPGTNPAVVSTIPIHNAKVNVNTPISIVFSKQMDKTSVESAFSIDNGVNAVGTFKWSDDSKTVIFYPAFDFEYETTYTVIIDSKAQDIQGNSLINTGEAGDSDPNNPDYIFKFTTISEKAPTLIYHYPESDDDNVASHNFRVILLFSNKMDITDFKDKIVVSSSTDILTIESVSYDSSFDKKVLISFKEDPKLNTTYQVFIPEILKDTYGRPLEKDYTFSFKTAKELKDEYYNVAVLRHPLVQGKYIVYVRYTDSLTTRPTVKFKQRNTSIPYPEITMVQVFEDSPYILKGVFEVDLSEDNLGPAEILVEAPGVATFTYVFTVR